jgi:hypothetical protein
MLIGCAGAALGSCGKRRRPLLLSQTGTGAGAVLLKPLPLSCSPGTPPHHQSAALPPEEARPSGSSRSSSSSSSQQAAGDPVAPLHTRVAPPTPAAASLSGPAAPIWDVPFGVFEVLQTTGLVWLTDQAIPVIILSLAGRAHGVGPNELPILEKVRGGRAGRGLCAACQSIPGAPIAGSGSGGGAQPWRVPLSGRARKPALLPSHPTAAPPHLTLH